MEELAAANASLRSALEERKRIAQALQDSEARYRLLLAQIRDYAIFAMDAEGRPVTWNEGVEAVLGYTADEFIGSSVELPFLRADIEAGVPQRELATAKETGVANDDRWLRKKDGTRFFAIGRTTSRCDAAGKFVGFIKVLRDETQRVLAEEALRASEARFRTLVQNLHDYAIFMLDPRGLITEWTEGAERVKGYRSEEVIGKHVSIFYPQDALEAGDPYAELQEAAVAGRVEREGWRLTSNGGRIWVNEIATAVYDSGHELCGFTKISRDLTLRKQTEDALRTADRRKDEFLATLAHELRNPLAPLRNGLQIMQVTSTPESRARSVIDMMNRQLTHLVRLVDDLMDVARIGSGKVELRRERVSLRTVITAAIEATRSVVEAQEHKLQIDLGPEDLLVHGDFDRLSQVMSNLLSNASKYMDPRGRIQVRLSREDDQAVVRVIDQGIGIPGPDLARVFELFSQVHVDQRRSQGGLGIGLSLVKRLVEMHGGQISARSEGPGRGSEFVVRLPLDEVHRQAEEVAIASGERPLQEGPRHRILVVDDNVDAATSLSTLLHIQGHEVALAFDGVEALEMAGEFQPDIVMLDLGMPRLDGVEAARRLRQMPGGERLALVALTGWGQESDRARTQQAGFDLHLVKPADPSDLERLLETIARR